MCSILCATHPTLMCTVGVSLSFSCLEEGELLCSLFATHCLFLLLCSPCSPPLHLKLLLLLCSNKHVQVMAKWFPCYQLSLKYLERRAPFFIFSPCHSKLSASVGLVSNQMDFKIKSFETKSWWTIDIKLSPYMTNNQTLFPINAYHHSL